MERTYLLNMLAGKELIQDVYSARAQAAKPGGSDFLPHITPATIRQRLTWLHQDVLSALGWSIHISCRVSVMHEDGIPMLSFGFSSKLPASERAQAASKLREAAGRFGLATVGRSNRVVLRVEPQMLVELHRDYLELVRASL